MITSIVQATGVVVDVGDDGYYRIHHWTRLMGSQGSTTDIYETLTWEEVADIIFQCATDSRPGWRVGVDYRQPPLFGPGADLA